MHSKKDFLINVLYIGVAALLVYLFFKFLFSPLSPFLTAFLIVSLSRSIIDKLTFKGLSKKAASIIFTLMFVFLFSLIIYGITLGLYKELDKLLKSISSSDLDSFKGAISDFFSNNLSFIKDNNLLTSLGDIFGFISTDINAVLENISDTFLPALSSFFMKFVSFFPAAVMFISIVFISVFYIGCDYDKILEFFSLQLSQKALDSLLEAKETFFSTAKELFRAYFVLTFITFLQLLTGFLIIGIDYAIILAVLICFVDLLPILGTGTVLVPWSVICFILGKTPTAAGLLVLYLFITIFRQIAEPKIVGANIGLSPLLSLISIFVGLRLAGIGGLIIFPIILMTIIRLNEKGLICLYKNFPENKTDQIKRTKSKFLKFKMHDKGSSR